MGTVTQKEEVIILKFRNRQYKVWKSFLRNEIQTRELRA
jgi:hypothetical protein